MKIAIFSVLFGEYDTWHDPTHIEEGANYYLFTDQLITSKVYKVINDYDLIDTDKILRAREIKIHNGYKFFCDIGYDLIIYHDSSLQQIRSLKPLYSKMQTDMMFMKHPNRKCIYEEFHACYEEPRDNREVMLKQVQGYADNGYPENNGLCATGVIMRRNNKKVLKFCRAWLDEVENGSIRDQLSCNYVLWKQKIKVDLIPFSDTLTWNFRQRRHKNKFIYKPK